MVGKLSEDSYANQIHSQENTVAETGVECVRQKVATRGAGSQMWGTGMSASGASWS